MTIHSLFSLFGAALCFALGCIVFTKNHRSSTTVVFTILCMFFSFWSFSDFQLCQSDNVNRVFYWLTFTYFWPLTIPLLLHFILNYSKYLNNHFLLIFLVFTYITALIFTYINLFILQFTPVLYSWGWGYDSPESALFLSSKIWYFFTSLIAAIVLFVYSGAEKSKSISNQTYYILIGMAVFSLAGFTSEILLPFMSIRIPDLTNTSFTLMAGFVGWAIWRHRLFSLDSSTAADTIISTMSDALAVVDLDHKIEVVNKSLLSMLGYHEDELIGADLHSIISNFKYQDSTLTTLMKKDFLADIETTFKKKDGTLIPISLSWSVLKENSIFRGFVFIARDMSERERNKFILQKAHDDLEKRVEERTNELKKSNEQLLHEISERTGAEQKLADEKEKLAITLKSIDDGVITTDVNGIIILFNQAAEDMIECNSENIIGRKLDEIYKPLQTKTKYEHEFDIIHEITNNPYFSLYGRQSILISKSGKEFTITETGVSIKDHQDNTTGYVIVFRDITEKNHLEEERFKARKLESISLLASGIAHDFNDLLTGIITNLFMAKMGIDSSIETYQLITAAEKAAFQASILTKQLLTFASNESTAKEETSIKEFIESAIGFYLKDSKSEYHLHLMDKLYNVIIDRGQIDKVLNNIIQNADQSMAEGGVILVNAENFILDNINPSLPLKHGKYVKISISDQGPGIPDEILPKIFDPYFSTKKKGNGLGLTTAYSIVQNHNGHITVYSQPDTGTTFTIYLPAVEKPDEENKNEKNDLLSTNSKILFIDDEEFVLKSTGQLLTHLGYNVCLAEDYPTALTQFKNAFKNNDPFAVVIMDLTISSGMGAKEMIDDFLSIDPEIRVIISSGYINDPIMVNYATYGFCGAMPKPYNAKELNEKIQEIIAMDNSKPY